MSETRTAEDREWNPLRLRVPREDAAILAHPPLSEAIPAALENAERLVDADYDIQGRTLSRLRREARGTALAAARRYTGELLGHVPEAADPAAPLFVAGHQPSLFHPGVWVKNFAIGALSRRAGGTALDIVVDNDMLATARLRVPVGDRARPGFERESFDADRRPEPWEEARVRDRASFASFGERLVARMANWGVAPLAGSIWSAANEAAARSGLLRDAFTAARLRVEREWGTRNLEVPLSRLCESDPFLWFASHLLVRAAEFQSIHNEILAEYRQVNRIRSRTHPVPELKTDGDWIETPFRVWHAGGRVRRNVFVRQRGEMLVLADGEREFAELPLGPGRDACCAVEVLRGLPARGIRFRTRALTTTLYARLCLADSFVHGIGGAKYDEMTDRIIGRFFRLDAPKFQTLTATFFLPLATPYDVVPGDATRLEASLRDLEHNPDRHLPPEVPAAAQRLADEKRRLISERQAQQAKPASRTSRRARLGETRARYLRFREIDRALQPFVTGERSRIEEELAEVRRQLEANTVLRDREASFALYPEDVLRRLPTEVQSLIG